MNLRQALNTQSPSLELQRSAAAEIARLDAIIGGPLDLPPRYSRYGDPNYGRILLAIESVIAATAQLHAAGVKHDDWPEGLIEIRRRARVTHTQYIDDNRKASRAAPAEPEKKEPQKYQATDTLSTVWRT